MKAQPHQNPNPVGGGPPRQPPPAVDPPPYRPGAPPPHYRPNIIKRWIPWLVPTIVLVNIVLFVYTMYVNDCPRRSNTCVGVSTLGRFAFQGTHENPLLGPTSDTLLSLGALEVRRVVQQHQVWRLASCMWLHAGVFHILANMLSLLFVGVRLEQEFGFVRIGVLYVISGIGGSLMSSLFVRSSISVGASGALFGLLGAMLSELLVNWTMYDDKLGALLSLLVIVLINLAVGILPHVDNFAHVGGFITGFLLGFVLLIRPQFGYRNARYGPSGHPTTSRPKYKIYQYILSVLSFILLIAGFVVGFHFLLRGYNGNEYCSWCRYMSCVPTRFWSCETRCLSSQYGNHLNMTCIHNNRTSFYILDNGENTSQIQNYCAELCLG